MKNPEPHPRYTYADIQEWDGRWELIYDVPYNMTPAPSTEHQRILGSLYFELRSFLKGTKCEPFVAPFDVRLSEEGEYHSPDHVCQPDISVICNPEQIDEKGVRGAPKLVIEILSPSTALKDRNEKFKLYEKYGVAEYWIVDPTHLTIEVYGFEEGSYRKREVFGKEDRLRSFALHEFTIHLAEVFH
ncbi:Uma2 family endonuclease [Paenibacillus sp. 481]|uniref:Uma2 family endonuclease n=1 Tax=Paenibacillus sp. 481 TaxID=2835869 RepID=UPI001E5CD24C|nr:Uma2 family endonuclease [Paenibacillus sp. 481]UHA72392.1 Uma2 family endonuclease [Paenibacillus sp. 481]